jgi:hypothetical protein
MLLLLFMVIWNILRALEIIKNERTTNIPISKRWTFSTGANVLSSTLSVMIGPWNIYPRARTKAATNKIAPISHTTDR